MFYACELGKSEALRETFKNPTARDVNARQTQIRMGQLPVVLSLIMVTDSILHPWLER